MKIKHQDNTWALIGFKNIQIALVTPGQHPPHFAVVDEQVATHRNKNSPGWNTLFYFEDPDKNVIEKIDRGTS